MRLVYKATGKEVKVGDVVETSRGEQCTVKYFVKPYKPSSEGKVTVQFGEDKFNCMEYYVSVIGAEWIEREDRL